MRLTTKGRFAVAAMLDLASHDDNTPIPLMSISERQHISLSYLEQLFSKLRRHALVKSFRGPGGGYRLAKARAEISIAEVIRAVDESVDATSCNGEGNCHHNRPCIAHELWHGLNQTMMDYLSRITLQDLVTPKKGRDNPMIRVSAEKTATVFTGSLMS